MTTFTRWKAQVRSDYGSSLLTVSLTNLGSTRHARRDEYPGALAVYALLGLDITTKTDAVSSFVIIFLIINFDAFLCRCESLTLPLVPANSQQLRTNGVLRHEAVVVERLEQRDVWNPLLLQ